MQNQGGMPHQQQPDDPPWETTLLGTDQRRTVLHKRAAQDQADLVYTPYGHSQDTSGLSGGLGFNGEPRESTTGHYLLGAGYRAFNPALMRFNNPDSLSPFEAGGLNPYAYCVGDPVNFVDPTGHLPSWAMMAIGIAGGVALGVVSGGVATLVAASMTASTAAAVGNTAMVIGVGLDVASVGTGIVGEVLGGKTGDLLGKVSLGLGLAGGVAGGFGGGMRIGAMTRAAKVKASTVWPEAEPVKYYDRPYLQRGVKRWSPVKKRRPDLEGGQSGRAELAPVYKRIRKIQRDKASDVSRNARVRKQRIELNEMLGAGTKQFWDLETKHLQTEFKYVEVSRKPHIVRFVD
jgi:RHS repeat-associated protein